MKANCERVTLRQLVQHVAILLHYRLVDYLQPLQHRHHGLQQGRVA